MKRNHTKNLVDPNSCDNKCLKFLIKKIKYFKRKNFFFNLEVCYIQEKKV